MLPVAPFAARDDADPAELRAELARVHLALERALQSCNGATAQAVCAALESELARLQTRLAQRPRRR